MDRDRDDQGRPRNARPRDGLGRLLDHGADGVPRQPEGVTRTADETIAEAQRLLDAGRPFHAHEVFEDAWKASDGPEAALWQALAQLAVGVTHGLRGNPAGAAGLLARAAAGLAPFAAHPPYRLAVGALRDWALAGGEPPVPALRDRTSAPAERLPD